MTLFIDQDFLRTPAAVDCDIFFLSFSDFLFAGRHGFTGFQTEHGNLFRMETVSRTGTVDCYVTAANNDNTAIQFLMLIAESIL
jgi:hypothetical protein